MIFEQLVDDRYGALQRVVLFARQAGISGRKRQQAAHVACVIEVCDQIVEALCDLRGDVADPRIVLKSNVGEEFECIDDFGTPLQRLVSPVTNTPKV